MKLSVSWESVKKFIRNNGLRLWIVIVIMILGSMVAYAAYENEQNKTKKVIATSSDTEVLLELWSKEQTNCLKKLNGMFAFVVYDSLERSITAVRDRLGVKPLYYYFDGNNFIFASEAKAILQHQLYRKSLNFEALSDYLSYGYITGSNTIYENINKLEPAQYMVIKGDKAKYFKYWNLVNELQNRPKASKEDIFKLIDSAIKYRLISDVPVGSFLSSGIDSSAISLIASKYNKNLQTYTIGFDEKTYDESIFVKEFINKHKINNVTKILSKPTIEELLEIIEYFDQPFFDTSTVPFFYLCKNTSGSIKTVLTGDGGDEIFAGYETRKADLVNHIAHNFPFWSLISKNIAYLLNFIPSDTAKVSFNYKLKQFFNFAYLPEEQAHYSWRLLFTEKEKKELLNMDITNNINNYESWSNFEKIFNENNSLPILQKEALTDLTTWLADDILYKADQCSMANTLELRSPFLDYRLVEAAFSIPEEKKFNIIKGKKYLRNIFKQILDKKILNRKKEGFGSPVGIWLKEHLKESFLDYINSNKFKKLIPNNQKIINLLNEHNENKRDNSYRLWTIFMLALWQERWMK